MILFVSTTIVRGFISTLILQLSFLVPSDTITSVTLSITSKAGNVGDSITAFCNATLSVNVCGAMIEFDYGFTSNTVEAIAGATQLTDKTIILSSTIISGSDYTCTVTVNASGVCGGGGSEPACPTKTSNAVTPIVQCELLNVCTASSASFVRCIIYK